MKKILSIILIISALLFVLCSCGEEQVEMESISAYYIASEGGSIQGNASQSKEVEKGKTANFLSVTAIPSEGYRFIGWDDNSTSATRTDTLSQSTTFTAKFEKIEYAEITYTASEGGSISGKATQKIEIGKSTSEVEAVPSEGYHFLSWSDGVDNQIRSDIANENKTITASFAKNIYATITYSAADGGGIAGTVVQTTYVGSKTEEVTAVPFVDYDFIGWDDGVLTPSRTDIVGENKTVTAMFAKKEMTIAYTASEGGSIVGEVTQTIARGQATERVVARADDGYVFVRWDDGSTNQVRFDQAKADATYKAIFKKACVVEFICNSYGTIKGKAKQTVGEGEESKSVTAVAKQGYTFLGWSNGVSTPEITITASADLTLTAYFIPNTTGLPVISITTENSGEITKENYIGCSVSLLDTETNNNIILQTGKIKGRGNSTWKNFDKKPYKIKLDSKEDLFGFGKAKDWVLLADYIDGSLIRNMLAYRTALELSELDSSPNCQSVEVYLNGEYRGIYLLCEQVEINKHRVEISEDETFVDTGYLVEMDGWTDTVQVYVPDNLNKSRRYTIKAPDSDVITAEQKEFIKQYLTDCMTAIQGDDYQRVQELIDVKSFAQAYIIFELFKNPDVDYSSVYFHKDAGGKLCCGPVWDFDMSIGNVNHKGDGVFKSTKTLWTKDRCPWFNELLRFNDFKKLVAAELLECEDKILDSLDENYNYVYAHAEAYKKNFEKWKVLGVNTWTNPSYIVAIDTWKGQVDYTRTYLQESLAYLIEYYVTE